MKQRLGVDLDNTLIDLDVHKELFKRTNNHIFKKSDVRDWDYSTFPTHIKDEIFDLFMDKSFMCSEHIQPFPNVQDKIKELNEKYEIILITARNMDLYESTQKMVNRLFPEIKDFNTVGFNMSKKELFIDKKLDYWVDDSPHGVIDALNLNIKTYLISNDNTKYNHHIKDFENLNVIECISKIEL